MKLAEALRKWGKVRWDTWPAGKYIETDEFGDSLIDEDGEIYSPTLTGLTDSRWLPYEPEKQDDNPDTFMQITRRMWDDIVKRIEALEEKPESQDDKLRRLRKWVYLSKPLSKPGVIGLHELIQRIDKLLNNEKLEGE